jgi:hypothetical protein
MLGFPSPTTNVSEATAATMSVHHLGRGFLSLSFFFFALLFLSFFFAFFSLSF